MKRREKKKESLYLMNSADVGFIQQCGMAVHFCVLICKKPSIAGGQIDMENDSALFIHDAADEQLTVGGDIRHRWQMFHHEWGKIPRA